MPRPFTRDQAYENQAFLRELRRTANIRGAARAIGRAYGTMQHRRGACAGFAAEWDAALAFAQGSLNAGGGRQGPEGRGRAQGPAPLTAHRTRGGEMTVVTCRTGGRQVRPAHPGKLTKQCEQAFLLALSASCNVRLAARAAGASEAAFYRRKRNSEAFEREWRLALERGYEALVGALMIGETPGGFLDDAWRAHNEAPDTPRLTFNQMIQLLYLHQKEVRLTTEPPPVRRRPGESRAALSERLAAMGEERARRERERFEIAEAAREARGLPRYLPKPIALPALDQVTGWSKADPAKTPHDATTAMFGGWRLQHLEARERMRRARER